MSCRLFETLKNTLSHLSGCQWLTSLAKDRQRVATTCALWDTRRILGEAALGRDLVDVIAWAEHLYDSIDMRQFDLKAHYLKAPRFDLAIQTCPLINECGDHMCFSHGFTLGAGGCNVDREAGAFAT